LKTPTSSFDRRHDLDALRASAMILGIFYHAALSLALGFPWFVQDPSANKGLYVFQSWVHGFRMPLFFIICGFFTAMLWKKRGAWALLRHRLARILLPCLVGAISLVPLCNFAILRASIEGNQRRTENVLKVPAEANIWAAIRHHRIDAVTAHLDRGYQWNDLHPEFKITALSWAAIHDDMGSLHLLLQRGCDPNIANPDGNTALHSAMFFGRPTIVECLLQNNADYRKKNLNGETPIDSLRVDPAFVPFIAGLLLVEVDPANVKHGRQLIENQIASLDVPSPGKPDASTLPTNSKTTQERLRALGSFLKNYPAFSYLWFLWFLWWLVVCFVILVAVMNPVRSIWTSQPVNWKAWKLDSPLALFIWIVITMLPIYRMEALGYMFGPDTSVGFFPAPHVFIYYAIFFSFGIVHYLSDDSTSGDPTTGDRQARLGSTWPWMLPLSMFVLFPIALEINLGTWGIRDSWIPATSVRNLSALTQSIFAWWMSLACIGLFQHLFREPKASIRYLSDSSYWLYVAHLPLVILVQSKMAGYAWDGFLKLILISGVSIGLLLLSYQLLVRNTWIGRFLNGPRTKQ
jgi:hypothetical protein